MPASNKSGKKSGFMVSLWRGNKVGKNDIRDRIWEKRMKSKENKYKLEREWSGEERKRERERERNK